ncbi:ABC transporter ATP-binding protein [Agarivorans sp. QJM3NY_29]|uniref:ABC transporter ATP-binding protein n=1 Tax=unclassified Agarivorans TaxID=2636026 RepID=UPI003D7C3855
MLVNQSMSRKQAFLSILKETHLRVITSIVCAVLASIIELIPWLCVYLGAQSMLAQQPIGDYVLLLSGALIIRYLLHSCALWQAHLVAYHVISKLRQHIILSLAEMPVERLKTWHRADLEKRISEDCQALEPLIAHHSTDIINGILMPILLAGLLFYIDWRIGLIAFIPLPIAASIQFLFMRGFSGRLHKYHDVLARMHAAQLEFLRSVGVMKLFSVDAKAYQQLYQAMRRHHRLVISYTQQMIRGWISFVTIAQCSFMLVVPFAIAFVIDGSMTKPDLVMVAVITAGLLKPWLDLTQVVGQMQSSLLSLDRIIPLFGQKIQQQQRWSEPVKAVTCRDVCLYQGQQTILKQAEGTILPGERVLIYGASGSGKSSLIGILSGSLKADRGDWYINDTPVSQLNDQQRAGLIALVGQQAIFFKASLRANLLISDLNIKDEVIWTVLNLMRLSDMVEQLPHQLDTQMDETRRSFSGGEMQRLAIARAMLADTPILVLDESTAHLDAQTELEVLEALRGYSPHQIQIIITHKPNQVSTANRRWRLCDSAIVEEYHD